MQVFQKKQSAESKIRALIQTVALQRVDEAASRKNGRVVNDGSVLDRSLAFSLTDESDVIRRKQRMHMDRAHLTGRGNHDDDLPVRIRRVKAVREPFAPKNDILSAELISEFEISRIAVAKEHGCGRRHR